MKWRKLLHNVLIVIGFLLVLGLTTCIPVNQFSTSAPQNEESIPLYVLNHGYHVSIVIPVKSAAHDFTAYFPELPARPDYWELAWGDRDYYTGKFSLVTGLKALFLPTDGVMHVTTMYKEPSETLSPSAFVKLQLSPENFQQLINWVDESLHKNAEGKPVYIQEGLYRTSGFYKAKGQYTFLFNCNNWVNRGLRKAGVKTPLWGGLAPMVMMYLAEH